jgi:hypothetical protein
MERPAVGYIAWLGKRRMLMLLRWLDIGILHGKYQPLIAPFDGIFHPVFSGFSISFWED